MQARGKQYCRFDSQVASAMKLADIKGRVTKCCSVSAKTGDGLKEAIDWAVTFVAEKKK